MSKLSTTFHRSGEYFVLRTLTSFVLLFGFIFTLSTASRASATRVDGAQFNQKLRMINAQEQLRRYHKRMDVERNTSKYAIPGSTAPTRVQMHLNGTVQTSSTIFFYDDMESGINGWTTTLLGGSDDLWHQTTSDASSATHSWWLGIEGQGNYETGNRIHTALVSPAIDLTTATGSVSLLFLENYITEQGWDFCMVDVSTDGGANWIPLRGGYGTSPNGDGEGWNITSLDLTPYAGSIVSIRFAFDTGDERYNNFPGWFIDDMIVFDQGGQITGKKVFDVNNNGIKDDPDRGLRDWLITGTGPVTITARTNYRGRYWLTLPLGTYTLTETPQSGWAQTFPATGNHVVSLSTPDTLVDSIHFGNWRPASLISGVNFHDFNRDAFRDPSDTGIAEWKIVLYDTSGNELDFDRTDSTGYYSLFVIEPGEYIVEQVDRHGWVQSYPDTSYRLNIPATGLEIGDMDFANYYTDSVNSVLGQKFNDLNRNGIKDDHEPGLAGFVIHLTAPGVGNKYRTTDSLGYYKFLSLPENKTYTISEIGQPGWCQSMPASPYTFALTSGEYMDNADFGNYEVLPGSISGIVFDDQDGNGIMDSGENGLPGFDVNLSGTIYGSLVNVTLTSGANGEFSFSGLWPGSYTLGEIFRQGWVQTYPANFASHQISLACEEIRSGITFGNIDSVYLASYRTFTMDSLALAKDLKGKTKLIPVKPNKNEFCARFVNAETLAVRKLTIRFGILPVLESLTISKPGLFYFTGSGGKFLEITLETLLEPGDSIDVCGLTLKTKLESVKRWWWTFADAKISAKYATSPMTFNVLRLPMPNAINVLEKTGNGLRVGLGGAHSVVHPTYKAVITSLVEKGTRLHIGPPRCLATTTKLKKILKQRKHMTPTIGQNVLFANAIAFKVNILASQLGITQPGLGGLVYDDGTGTANPLNNFSLYDISAKLDSFMTQDTCHPLDGTIDAQLLNDVIVSVNGAFSGPMDTVSFASGLVISPVRPLADVPFLRYDTSAFARVNQFIDIPVAAVPEMFELYQNYPNPFNPTTTIEFNLPTASLVTLRVYNTLGQEVALVRDREEMEDGIQMIDFSSDEYGLASGVYFYRLEALSLGDGNVAAGQTFTSIMKMVLIK
jgi:hypothetical protein